MVQLSGNNPNGVQAASHAPQESAIASTVDEAACGNSGPTETTHSPATSIQSFHGHTYNSAVRLPNPHNDDESASSVMEDDDASVPSSSIDNKARPMSTSTLAAEEERLVTCSKMLLVMVLLLTMAAFATITYFFTSQQQEDDLVTRFTDFANQIITVYELNGEHIVGTLEEFSTSLTAHAIQTNSTWPLVTVPLFEALAERAIQATGSRSIGVAPLVPEAQQGEWLGYVMQQNEVWRAESYKHMGLPFIPSTSAGGPPPGVGGTGGGPPPGAGGIDAGAGPPPGVGGTNTGAGPPPGVAQGSGPPAFVTGENTSDVSTTSTTNGPPAFVNNGSNSSDAGGSTGGPPDWVLGGGDDGTAPPIFPFIWTNFTPPRPVEGVTGASSPISKGKFAPFWQVAPVVGNDVIVNHDTFTLRGIPENFDRIVRSGRPVLSEILQVPRGGNFLPPESYILSPVFATLRKDLDYPASTEATTALGSLNNRNRVQKPSAENRTIVATVISLLPWHNYFVNLLPEDIDPIYIVIRSNCGVEYTFLITGPDVSYLGNGDFHDTEWDAYEVKTTFSPFEGSDCQNSLYMYPTSEFHSTYITDKPIIYTVGVIIGLSITALVFVIYDCTVKRRQDKVMTTATRSTAIVSSLFPRNVQDRLMEDAAAREEEEQKQANLNRAKNPVTELLGRYDKNKDAFRMANRASDSAASCGPVTVMKSQHSLGPFSPSSGHNGDGHQTSFVGASPQRSAGMGLDGGYSQHSHSVTEASMSRKLSMASIIPASSMHQNSKPIADLFPNASVLFADIVGFTAWSSVREPTQVFILLEGIYNAFDKLARKRGVFKVETIGDCYVAATGLPEQQEHHALIMAKFARDCLAKMSSVLRRLEVSLGPDTVELGMRVGINSGPVTAGVLRGEKSRFQLFGDTVNTAARMESTGKKHKIHLSASAAISITASMEASEKTQNIWIMPRNEPIDVKGKGQMKTFWLAYGSLSTGSATSSTVGGTPQIQKRKFPQRRLSGLGGVSEHEPLTQPIDDGSAPAPLQQKTLSMKPSSSNGSLSSFGDSVDAVSTTRSSYGSQANRSTSTDDDDDSSSESAEMPEFLRESVIDRRERLIDWNVDVLRELLQKIVAMRRGHSNNSTTSLQATVQQQAELRDLEKEHHDSIKYSILDEVQEIIELPNKPAKYGTDPQSVHLDDAVVAELRDFVSRICYMYRDNSFHCFEHASHVTQSVIKLIHRVVTPDSIDYKKMAYTKTATKTLHQYTYGITSDPLTQFSVALSALIHDVDHPGVPNAQLCKERDPDAVRYKFQSVAEQNSIDLGWDLLMAPQYEALRACIYSNCEEFNRFRQLIVNTVMATDIVDKELGLLRKKRWETAFANVQPKHPGSAPATPVPPKKKILKKHSKQFKTPSPVKPGSVRSSVTSIDFSGKMTETILHKVPHLDLRSPIKHNTINVNGNGSGNSANPNKADDNNNNNNNNKDNLLLSPITIPKSMSSLNPSNHTNVSETTRNDMNRKATIVIEHLIQASDVSHTMQHWHVYLKWNERFFEECAMAYKEGRAGRDPAKNWYTGELGFFDHYIIPLAKKLKDCGVFGVASDEYLNYATANRKEWEAKGQAIVEEYVRRFQQKNG